MHWVAGPKRDSGLLYRRFKRFKPRAPGRHSKYKRAAEVLGLHATACMVHRRPDAPQHVSPDQTHAQLTEQPQRMSMDCNMTTCRQCDRSIPPLTMSSRRIFAGRTRRTRHRRRVAYPVWGTEWATWTYNEVCVAFKTASALGSMCRLVAHDVLWVVVVVVGLEPHLLEIVNNITPSTLNVTKDMHARGF